MKLLKQLLSEARQLEKDMSTERAIELLKKRVQVLNKKLVALSGVTAFSKLMPNEVFLNKIAKMETYSCIHDIRGAASLEEVEEFLSKHNQYSKSGKRMVLDFYLRPEKYFVVGKPHEPIWIFNKKVMAEKGLEEDDALHYVEQRLSRHDTREMIATAEKRLKYLQTEQLKKDVS